MDMINLLGGLGRGRPTPSSDPRRRTLHGELKMPKFVKFHPEDPALLLNEVFWEDPHEFNPYKCPVTGRIIYWGTVPMTSKGHADIDPMQFYGRTMESQLVYNLGQGAMPSPEMQFISVLMDKKREMLKHLDTSELATKDYILKIHVEYMPDDKRIERKIRLSGGLSLPVFSDKIMKPLFGLVRNLHAHIFQDFSDGSQFGPRDCNSVDMVHLDKTGYTYIPDDEYTLAHFLRKPGDELGYLYDFGDNWHFLIKVEDIVPVEDSDGKIVVLGGTGAHPPDGVPSWVWVDLMGKVDSSSQSRKEALDTLYNSTGYAAHRRNPNFDFNYFSVDETQKAVQAALDSKLSVFTSAKHFVAPLAPGHDDDAQLYPRNLKKGQKLVRTPIVRTDGAPTRVFMEEGVAQKRRDNPDTTACSNCGSPHNLKACSGCKQRYYCSRSCQRAHWAQGHKRECTGGKKK